MLPIHKGGSKVEASEYRPISLTSHLMKTGERVIRKKLVNYLEFYNKMDSKQHGSRENRSTLSQLLVHYDEISRVLKMGKILTLYILTLRRPLIKLTMEFFSIK